MSCLQSLGFHANLRSSLRLVACTVARSVGALATLHWFAAHPGAICCWHQRAFCRKDIPDELAQSLPPPGRHPSRGAPVAPHLRKKGKNATGLAGAQLGPRRPAGIEKTGSSPSAAGLANCRCTRQSVASFAGATLSIALTGNPVPKSTGLRSWAVSNAMVWRPLPPLPPLPQSFTA